MSNAPLNLAQIAAWERVAAAATQGEWYTYVVNQFAEHPNAVVKVVYKDSLGRRNHVFLSESASTTENNVDNATHIATFDPPTVLRLIAALRASVEREGATCEWKQHRIDKYLWETSCGEPWLNDDAVAGLLPEDVGIVYCFHCGKRVVVAEERGADE